MMCDGFLSRTVSCFLLGDIDVPEGMDTVGKD